MTKTKVILQNKTGYDARGLSHYVQLKPTKSLAISNDKRSRSLSAIFFSNQHSCATFPSSDLCHPAEGAWRVILGGSLPRNKYHLLSNIFVKGVPQIFREHKTSMEKKTKLVMFCKKKVGSLLLIMAWMEKWQ